VKLHYRLSWVALLAFARAVWGYRRTGTDAIPRTGPVIIACNHASNWDPILVGLGCPREVHFLAKEELFANPLLAALIRSFNALPVRRGTMDRGALKAASRVLRDGGALLMFPSGRREASGEIGNVKAGVGFIACMNGTPVVPAYIRGSNALGRAFVGGERVEVAFAPAIPARKAESSDNYRELSRRVADEMERLKLEVDGR
jgi:1-acyl-sn-glycerol-3-phosphate acyltransferase